MNRNPFPLFELVGLWLLAGLQAGCPQAGDPCAAITDDLERAYLAAIQDAATAEAEEISRELLAIADYNPNLVWEETDGPRRLRVVTWTSWDGYDELVGQDTTLSRDVWVTVVPELQEFCLRSNLDSGAMELRLKQLLGLPPDAVKDRFVELWVEPDDLFRPSPDPEISDHEALLTWPSSGGFLSIAADYISWFDSLMAESYGDQGYPWTRLGYTYDWGNPCTDVGLSEFVIRRDAIVGVHAVLDNASYTLFHDD